MAYDEGVAELLRQDLSQDLSQDLGPHAGLTEKRMFGGLAFLLDGHMVCGVSSWSGAMYRVGKSQEGEALALPGVAPFAATGRRMGGFVVLEPVDDDAIRARLTAMARAFVATLPPKG